MFENNTSSGPLCALFWWLMVNGRSILVHQHEPLPATVQVKPVPEMLVGFTTFEEAIENEQFLLTAPAKEMHKRLADLRRRAAKGEVVVIRPENPEPPRRDHQVYFMAGDEKEERKVEEEILLREVINGRELIIKRMHITSQIAEEWLGKNHPNNRHLKLDRINKYSTDMAAGRWLLNAETIKFDWDGLLQDGQNRLTACVRTGVSFWSLVAFGVDPAAFVTIDSGAGRTGGDVLFMGGEQNANELAATLNLVHVYETRGEQYDRYFDRSPLPKTLLHDELNKHPIIREHVAWAVKVYDSKSELRLLTKPLLGFIRYVLTDADPVKAEDFCSRLLSGTDLHEGDPILVLRRHLIHAAGTPKKRLPRRVILAYVFKAWNAFYDRQQIKGLKFGEKEPFPEVAGSKLRTVPAVAVAAPLPPAQQRLVMHA